MTRRQQWTFFIGGVAVLLALALGVYLGKNAADHQPLPAVEGEAEASTDE